EGGQPVFERVYDYGLFDGSSPTLVADFLQGRMRYWVGVTTLHRTMRRYRATNRDVAAQKLRLTQDRALELLRKLEENIKPENRFYRYDYYYDNCSTRVRDVIDDVTEGAVKKAFVGDASMTLREHTLRHTSSDWLYYLGLDIGLADVDRSIDLWVESFLPQNFREGLRKVQVVIDGQTVPLVEEEEVWFESTRPAVPAQPPSRVGLIALIGLGFGGLFVLFGEAARRFRFEWALVLWVSLTAFVLSFFGGLLVFLWGFTDHEVAYANENIFHLAPWGLVAPLVAVWSRRALFWVLASAAAFSMLGLAVKVVPVFGQDTFRLIALLLPIWVGMAVSIYRSMRTR
ncbi:MAG: DUF4105 domain-containing protein, partial [Myxococcota bacterium]